jgi:hypothetical protein
MEYQKLAITGQLFFYSITTRLLDKSVVFEDDVVRAAFDDAGG